MCLTSTFCVLTKFLGPVHQKLVFCTGQIYYELLGEREKREIDDVALVRLEQIAPFAFDRVAENAAKYKNAEIVWAQQEPK
jgi:2-oxoglutarate dehydrogenase E1 component